MNKKKILIITFIFTFLFTFPACCEDISKPEALVGINIVGPFLGFYQLDYEASLSDRWSFIFSPFYVNYDFSLFGRQTGDLEIKEWGAGGEVGFSYYFGETPFRDFFIETVFNTGYYSYKSVNREVGGIDSGVSFFGGYRWFFYSLAVSLKLSAQYRYAFFDITRIDPCDILNLNGIDYGIYLNIEFLLF